MKAKKLNIGSTDRAIRVVIALVLFAQIFTQPNPIRWLGLLGIIPLATAIIGTCPIYRLFNFDTCDTGFGV